MDGNFQNFIDNTEYSAKITDYKLFRTAFLTGSVFRYDNETCTSAFIDEECEHRCDITVVINFQKICQD